MQEVPQHPHVLVTHTDAPELYVWNTDAQPDRAGVKVRGPGRAVPCRAAPAAGLGGKLAGLGAPACPPPAALVGPHTLGTRSPPPAHPTCPTCPCCPPVRTLQSTSAKQHSVADLVLEGHTEDAKFAMSVFSVAPLVASGGSDMQVRGACRAAPVGFFESRCVHGVGMLGRVRALPPHGPAHRRLHPCTARARGSPMISLFCYTLVVAGTPSPPQ